MKLMDEKGRLFGKVNVVDLIVLVIIIAIIGAVAYRLTSSKVNMGGGNPLNTEDKYCYVTVISQLVVPEVAEGLKVGDKLVANSEFTDAEIVSIKSEPAAFVGTNSEGEAVLGEHPLWQDVTVVVKEKIDPTTVILKVGNQEVRVGYSFILKTQTVETNCKIRGIEFKDS